MLMANRVKQTDDRLAQRLCNDDTDHSGDDALIARYIEPGPLNLGPSEAQVAGHGVSVWALMSHLESESGDIARTAAAYELNPDAVEAAVRYYCRHRALIDARILLNRSYFDS